MIIPPFDHHIDLISSKDKITGGVLRDDERNVKFNTFDSKIQYSIFKKDVNGWFFGIFE